MKVLSSSSVLLGFFLSLVSVSCKGDQPDEPAQYRHLPPLKVQAQMQDDWRDQRLTMIPKMLQKYNTSAWLMPFLEYSEDTVFWSLKSATQFSGRRRTIYLFHQNTTALTKNDVGEGQILAGGAGVVWVDNREDLVYSWVKKALEKLEVESIALNISPTEKFADGLHAGERETLTRHLSSFSSKLTSIEMLPIEFIATRLPLLPGRKDTSQLKIYRQMMEMVWAMIEEGFSDRFVETGVTTTVDVEWFFRNKMEEMHVSTWFHPSVSLFRATYSSNPDQQFPSPDPSSPSGGLVIQPGDMLHVDIGIFAMGLATDTQHLAYVLKPDEVDAPESLKKGLRSANRMQDLLKETMSVGKTGDEVLRETRGKMAAEGIKGLVYSHPIGDWGHSAGTVIGMTNLQEGVPHTGAFPMLTDSCYSIELSAEGWVDEWNKTQNFFQEEDVCYSSYTGGWEWVRGRQEKFWLVKPTTSKATVEGAMVIQG